MFNWFKNKFGKKTQEQETAPTTLLAEVNKTPTKGIALDSQITISSDVEDIFGDQLTYHSGKENKVVVGIAQKSEDRDNVFRVYTDDDYFVEIEYFGEDKAGNEATNVVFQLVHDIGADQPDDEQAAQWKMVIENDLEFEYKGNKYRRETNEVYGGLEVVEIGSNEIKPLDHTYAIFNRPIGENFEELLIVNAECKVTLDEDTGEILSYDDLNIWVAVGMKIKNSEFKAYNQQQ
ncbi:DUF2491 family protein [Vibrio sp. D431a]|uniref:DUF2491 family protein n=1 Tax=Vibrio sp. D431a TaxID=2837388 RepID=UPI002556F3A4|nr:DUF2491 family protein [Vibrio sp. D431a]MDK9789805.1 DUF2491 family protein [Vibrio sp. D431a]